MKSTGSGRKKAVFPVDIGGSLLREKPVSCWKKGVRKWNTAAIQRHDMVLSDLLQVPEILYHRDLLTAEGQVDEVLDR